MAGRLKEDEEKDREDKEDDEDDKGEKKAGDHFSKERIINIQFAVIQYCQIFPYFHQAEDFFVAYIPQSYLNNNFDLQEKSKSLECLSRFIYVNC